MTVTTKPIPTVLILGGMTTALVFLAATGTSQSRHKVEDESKVLFFDDFSSPTLDRSRWNVRVSGPVYNNEQQAYIDSTDTVHITHGDEAQGAANGALVIEARYRPGFVTPQGRKFDFVSGRLDTADRVQFTYGTAAARMKLPASSGLWPAFWAMGNGRWPDTGEIDIMENIGEPDWFSVALHGPRYSGETPLVNRYYFKEHKDATDWHVYSVDWKPDSLIFRVDGEVMYRVTKAMVEHFGRWAYDNPKYLILNLALGGGYPEKINRVKSPYPGLPKDTVDLIKAGKAKVLVDWVRITKE
jgi:beta-glucanase (GH16 family)